MANKKGKPSGSKKSKKIVKQKVSFLEKDKGYSGTIFIFGGPRKNPGKKNLIWATEYGKRKFKMVGHPDHGLPYGINYRMLQIYIDTQITYSKHGKGDIKFIEGKPTINLGKTLRGMARLIGVREDGDTLKDLRKQWNKYSRISINIETKENNKVVERQIPLFTNMLFIWEEDSKGKRSLFESYVEINSVYFDYIKKHGMPLNPEIVKKVKKSAVQLDFYRFISYRYNAGVQQEITIKDIAKFFNIESRLLNFTNTLTRALNRIKDVEPDFFAEIKKGDKYNNPARLILAPQKEKKIN